MAQRFVRDDATVKESVLNLITNIDPVENYVISNFQKSTAVDEFHFVPRQTLRTATNLAGVEGADPSYTGTDPTKALNMLQIVDIGFDVTDSESATDRYGSPEDRIALETENALKDWANSAEFAVVRSTLVTGNNSTARQMSGLKACLTISTSQSGISLTETILNDYLQNAWNSGANVDLILAPMYHKRKLSAFTGNGATKFYNADDKRLVTPIQIYESDASSSPIKLVAHRYMKISTDTHYDILGVEMDKFAVAYLREPKVRALAKTGDAERRQVIGELTLECRSDVAGFIGQRHL